MPADEVVSASQVLAAAGADKAVTTPTFLQRTGSTLAACVGSLGALVILSLVFGWMHSAPSLPVIPSGADSNTAKALLEDYRTLQQIALEPYTTLLDSIVVKVLLPVFTSILGYIFGTRSGIKE